MKILKVISKQSSIYSSIKYCMDTKKGITAMNQLDACGCTGNGVC